MNPFVFWMAAFLGRPPDLVHKVWNAALMAKINPLLTVALVEEESRFNPKAVRRAQGYSDYGLFQLCSLYHPQFRGSLDSHISYSVVLLAFLLRKHGVVIGLSVYNTGRDSEVGRKYAGRVLSRYDAILAALPFLADEREAEEEAGGRHGIDKRRGGRIVGEASPIHYRGMERHLEKAWIGEIQTER